MVIVELDISPEEKEKAEKFLSLNGKTLGIYLGQVAKALVLDERSKQTGFGLLEALKTLPKFTGEYPKNAEEDKIWLEQALKEKHGI